MKVFITGATGFVGGHLYESLLRSNHEVIGLARSSKKWEEFNLPGNPLIGDLSQDSINQWIEKLPQDLTHVVHTAGVVHSFEEEVFEEINTKATVNLFEALKKRYPKLHFVFISSLAAAGPSRGERLTEKDQEAPVSAYGRSKLEAEKSLSKSLPSDYLLTIIRPPMVIGPRDPAVLDVFKMVKGKVILNTGLKGPQKRYSIIGVFDLVAIIEKSMNRDSSSQKEVFYPSFGADYSFKNIIEEISSQLNVSTVSLPIPFPLVSGLAKTLALLYRLKAHQVRLTPDKINELRPMSWTCSGEKAVRELDFQYEWDLKRIVTNTIKDYQQRNWL